MSQPEELTAEFVECADELAPLREMARAVIGDENFTDCSAQVAETLARARAEEWFASVTDVLVRRAVQSVVWLERHRISSSAKGEALRTRVSAAGPVRRGPVSVANSPAVAEVSRSLLDRILIGGKRLGDVTGAEIDAIADSEMGNAVGSLFNADLLRWCERKGVTGDKRVRDVVSESELAAAIKRLTRKARETVGLDAGPKAPQAAA